MSTFHLRIIRAKYTMPTAAEQLKKIADDLIGGELIDFLNAMCEDPDEETRVAAKAYLDSLNQEDA